MCCIRSVAKEAVVRKQRPDLAVEIDAFVRFRSGNLADKDYAVTRKVELLQHMHLKILSIGGQGGKATSDVILT